MKRILGLVALGVVVLFVAGCVPAEEGSSAEQGVIVRATISREGPATDIPITIEGVQPGEPIGVDFRGSVISGTVSLQFLGPEGDLIWEKTVDSIGPFVINEVLTATSPISHQLGLAWDEALDVSYALGWQPGEFVEPVVKPIALLRGVGVTALALAVVAYTATRKLGWKYLGLGALIWLSAFILEFGLAGSLNYYVGEGLSSAFAPEVAVLISYAYSGAMVGLCEVVAVYLLLRYTALGKAPFDSARAFGLGFGGAECLVSGLLLLYVSVLALTEPETVPLVVADISTLNNPLYGIAPILEQAGTILVHCFSLVLVFYAIVTDRARPVLDAFGYKFAYVAIVSIGQAVGGESPLGMWAVAVAVVLWGAFGVLGCRKVRERYPEHRGH